MPTFQPGQVFHQLVIEELLASGFHGEVYATCHRHTGDRFALKVTHVASRADPRAVRQALETARANYAVDHANVVKVHDLGSEDDGMVWMRMELLKGCTLARLIAWQGRLSPTLAVAVACEAAWGLAAAHEEQIVHRDVKPANLFLVDLGGGRTALKVLDFSIAKWLAGQVSTTLGRAAQGTAAYMAPDQLYGGLAHPGFDVYSLGMSLWEMMAGFHPYLRDLQDMTALVARQVREMPPSLSAGLSLPPEVDRVIGPALAKAPGARYPSMSAFAQALGELRAFLAREEEAGRVRFHRYAREPVPPGDARHLRAYAPPAPVPEAPQPKPAQWPRVVVSAPADDLSDVAATLPLDGGLADLFGERDAIIPPQGKVQR
jgi:serine/threonine-protein kinase